MTTIKQGSLVTSKSAFSGIGKVVGFTTDGLAKVCFFESPLNPHSGEKLCNSSSLSPAKLYEESIVFCRPPESSIWSRARYIGPRPDGKHLIIYRKGQEDIVEISEIYSQNLSDKKQLDPVAFLATRSNDAPYYFPLRQAFNEAYIAQRGVCRSIASLQSSGIELEPHQIAVVRRVLQNDNPKFLLADEVGLGKTIEAGLIIREHILERKRSAKVLVVVPEALLEQWRDELSTRFALGDLLASSEEGGDNQIRLCPQDKISQFIGTHWQPTLIAVDEAHQIAPFAWSENIEQREKFLAMAELSAQADIALLLSGTPMHGNEKNFLAMLHCLSPEAYPLNTEGVEHFMMRVIERERLGGLYSALTDQTPNAALEANLDELVDLFTEDVKLQLLAEELRPLVDFFALEEGEERSQAINKLRSYIGEHYRLHHRLLRNRRENSALRYLFPGLAGLKRASWSLSPTEVCLDELIEEYRSLAKSEPKSFKAMNDENCLEWIDDLLLSPLTVGHRAQSVLNTCLVSEQENSILKEIIKCAKSEQQNKDLALVSSLVNWLRENPKGKAVVFCSEESVASHLYEYLKRHLNHTIELHKPGTIPSFNQVGSLVRVLICDRQGEDGLNLHGGQRLAVHYSISRNFNRIEQRLGRFNRYSANLRGVSAVVSQVIIPERPGLTSAWVDLLDNGIGLFSQTVASLQFVLEEHLNTVWKDYVTNGCSSIQHATTHLNGENGMIAQERKRVNAQEQLLSLEQEVIEATEFAEQLANSDEQDEAQSTSMLNWITKALNFSKKQEVDGSFRLCFETGERGPRTLVDVRSFIDTCLLGLDFDNGFPPSTEPMSFSRCQAEKGAGVYPFRYGQPFIDTVWQLMQTDPRGTTSAFLRLIPGAELREPKIFFQFSYLTTARPNTSDQDIDNDFVAQRLADEILAPKVESMWLGESGRQLMSGPDSALIELLEKPYNKLSDGNYQDINLRSDAWQQLSAWLPYEPWRKTVLFVAEQALQQIADRHLEIKNRGIDIEHRILAARAVILCSHKTFQRES
ncbi:protein DpdE [Shewanella algae]|uniref:protein DpdE n=1 Tax=Shewanella algae TaxID=38313 RepID=UPI001AADB710|nr:protein DpdE [Shewanella algae]MBO2643884.1 DEAD/DEAH box helicase [Shewanella algae]QTE95379.1 DEAD/DEAH box helicase [Shewanella algae]